MTRTPADNGEETDAKVDQGGCRRGGQCVSRELDERCTKDTYSLRGKHLSELPVTGVTIDQ